MAAGCRPPIFIEPVFEDPGSVRELLERGAPYPPVQRYFRSAAEYRAQSGQGEGPMIVAPNFRGDWAYERPDESHQDPAFVEQLAAAYVQRPTTRA